ncbi:MAG: hypothetical protein MIO90_06415 [Methanomassiliicoccales archaeon]|nr:hypothetical protein [Methanomassiliicoccales archaeon]
MKEAFVLKGKWWIPANPDNAINGDMNFDPSKGAILNLGGLLRESDTCAMPFKIVLGETEDGRAITLIGSSGIWLEHPYRIADDGEPNVPTCSALCANILVIGKHYKSQEEIEFKGLTIDLSYLSDWGKGMEPGRLDLSQPKALALTYDIGLIGKLIIGSEGNGSCQLTIDLNSEISLDRGIEMVRQLRNLMALFMHRSTHEVRVWGAIGRGADDNGPKMKVEVFYPSFARDREANPLELEDMLMPLGSIGAGMGNIVSKWFTINENMAEVLDLYFAASQSAELYQETRFLMYMQAIEAYHRHHYRNFEVDPEEHRRRVAVILESIPEQYREWMRDGLEYSNEPSQGQRLKDIYDDLRDTMDEFVGDRKRFVFQLTRTRNHLTHLDDNSDDMVLKGNDLVLATMRLRLLLELCLLKELGIEPDRMRTAVMRNAIFSQIRV